MAACLLAASDAISITGAAPDSCSGYVLLSSAEYADVKSPLSTIDQATVIQLFSLELVLFVSAFACGFICRKLGR